MYYTLTLIIGIFVGIVFSEFSEKRKKEKVLYKQYMEKLISGEWIATKNDFGYSICERKSDPNAGK